jgi:acyl-coenzyme A synthetase/AMP-(fatty) acid ligase
LERLGRNDRQVKVRGARVDLDGVEAALREHALVKDVGVLARASSVDGSKSLSAHKRAR